MFRELVEVSIRNRGHVVPVGEIRPIPMPSCRYMSLFMFDKDVLPYVKTNGSIKDYKGKVYADAIWIDVDHEKDIEQARQSTISIVRRLNAEYGVNPEDLFIYFSGNKGFHIGILSQMVGLSPAAPVVMPSIKAFVKAVVADIPHVDFIIYEPLRIFRVANSKHEKTGLYKIQISFDELTDNSMEEISMIAANPRPQFVRKHFSGITENDQLKLLWEDSCKQKEEKIEEHEFSENLFQPAEQGGRNKKFFVQACYLFKKSELSVLSVTDILSCINKCSSDPIEQDELRQIIKNAERKIADERPGKREEILQVKSFGEWIPEWESYSLDEQSNMSLLFDSINKETKGRLKGKLGVVMGYGGSKKSLYCLNVLMRNIKATNEIGVYSTMEMSVPQLMNRIIDHEVNSAPYHAHDAVVYKYKQDMNAGRQFLRDELSKIIGNQIQITGNARLTFDHYNTVLERVTNTVGNPNILVVDGLSMMGGKGTENEVYSKNSADLKELANKWNILVLLVCHISKGAELHTRDLSRQVRGSEKILDNCDFYLTMSQIQDEYNPETYRQDIGFVNFKDKRGSGITIETLYSFDKLRLRLTDNPDDPKHYRESKKKSYSKIEEAPF
jgi:hypothetical protein